MTLKRLLMRLAMPVLLFASFASAAQTLSVTGRVTDAKSGLALAGVTVSEKGKQNGTSTDADGNYAIKAAPGATLVFSYVGYTLMERPAVAGTLDIALNPTTSTSLNEVMVIGYGAAKKKDLTGAVATVSEKEFQKGNITTPEQMIAGKVAGVQITSNGGRPGAGSTIRIRGGSSLAASNDPLIVIDGVPLDNNGISGAANPLSLLNPNDIESYTVLKDASAAAIYGSRANNGVIIITTKKGKGGKLKVNFSSINSMSKVTGLVDVLNADEVRSVVQQFGSATQKAQVGTANTNWQEQIYQTAYATDNNISLSGGIKGLPYRFSLGYMTQTGVLKTDRLDRTSMSLAVNPSFFDRHLKIDLNLKGTSQETRFANDGAIGSAVFFDPTQPVYANNKYGGYFEWVDAAGDLLLVRPNNPLGLLETSFFNSSPRRLIGNVQADYKFHFLPELRAVANLGYDLSTSNSP
ncbi:MAG TPA: SusC/RagA family TonB-linked outer membrane protein [Phnomibacter sp.]|nr:SusC/RagA family TonB-linked outer membrane protein [Phnomibacter sp.]